MFNKQEEGGVVSAVGFAILALDASVVILAGCVVYLGVLVRGIEGGHRVERRQKAKRPPRRESQPRSKSTADASSGGSAK